MARFELTISNGEKIMVEHAAADMREFAADLDGKQMVLFNEIKTGSSTPARELIVATNQITLVRSIGEGMLGSAFRGKRSMA
jgi:hypothetical protein